MSSLHQHSAGLSRPGVWSRTISRYPGVMAVEYRVRWGFKRVSLPCQTRKGLPTCIVRTARFRAKDGKHEAAPSNNAEQPLLAAQQLEGQLGQLEAELRRVQEAAYREATQGLEGAREQVKESVRTAELLEAMVGALRERLKREEDRNEALAEEIEAGRLELAKSEEQRRQLQQRIAGLRAELVETQTKLAAALRRAADLESRVAVLARQNAALALRVGELEDEVRGKAEALTTAAEAARDRIRALEAAADEDQLRIAKLQGQLAEREAQLAALQEGEVELQEVLEQSKAAANQMDEMLRMREAEIERLQSAVREAEERGEQDAEGLRLQLAAVEAAREGEVSRLREQLRDGEAQAEALRETAAARVAEHKKEVEALQGLLQDAKLRTEQASARRVAEVSELRSSLEQQVGTARQEALEVRGQLAAVKEQLDGVLSPEWLEALEEDLRKCFPSPTPPCTSPSSAATPPTSGPYQGSRRRNAAAAEAEKALRRLDSREAALRQQLEALQAELAELQAAAVARLGPALVARAQELEGSAGRYRQVLASRQAAQDEQGAQRASQQLEAIASELGSLYRLVMTPEGRARERAVRAEMQDREVELRSVLEQRAHLIEQQEQERRDSRKATAAASGAAQQQLRRAVQARVKELLQEREHELLQQAAAREQQLQAQLQARMSDSKEAQQRELQAVQDAVSQQVRLMENSWRGQLDAFTRSLREATAEKERLAVQASAATGQVKQQLVELDTLRQELAAAQAAVAALRRAAESSKAAAAQQSANTVREVQKLTAQVVNLQSLLHERERQYAASSQQAATMSALRSASPPRKLSPSTPPLPSPFALPSKLTPPAQNPEPRPAHIRHHQEQQPQRDQEERQPALPANAATTPLRHGSAPSPAAVVAAGGPEAAKPRATGTTAGLDAGASMSATTVSAAATTVAAATTTVAATTQVVDEEPPLGPLTPLRPGWPAEYGGLPQISAVAVAASARPTAPGPSCLFLPASTDGTGSASGSNGSSNGKHSSISSGGSYNGTAAATKAGDTAVRWQQLAGSTAGPSERAPAPGEPHVTGEERREAYGPSARISIGVNGSGLPELKDCSASGDPALGAGAAVEGDSTVDGSSSAVLSVWTRILTSLGPRKSQPSDRDGSADINAVTGDIVRHLDAAATGSADRDAAGASAPSSSLLQPSSLQSQPQLQLETTMEPPSSDSQQPPSSDWHSQATAGAEATTQDGSEAAPGAVPLRLLRTAPGGSSSPLSSSSAVSPPPSAPPPPLSPQQPLPQPMTPTGLKQLQPKLPPPPPQKQQQLPASPQQQRPPPPGLRPAPAAAQSAAPSGRGASPAAAAMAAAAGAAAAAKRAAAAEPQVAREKPKGLSAPPISEWGRPRSDAAEDAGRSNPPTPSNSTAAGGSPTASGSSGVSSSSTTTPPNTFFSEAELGAEIAAIAQSLVQRTIGGGASGTPAAGTAKGAGNTTAVSGTTTATAGTAVSSSSVSGGAGAASGRPVKAATAAADAGTAAATSAQGQGQGRSQSQSQGEPPSQPVRRLGLVVAAGAMAQPGKGSEDAYFIATPATGCCTNGVTSRSTLPDAALSALGVADGVGGWAEENVDPRQYSKEIMAVVAAAAAEAIGAADPRKLLAEAQASVRTTGSCTACVAVLAPAPGADQNSIMPIDGNSSTTDTSTPSSSPAAATSSTLTSNSVSTPAPALNDLLSIANLGDSGLRVVRRGSLVLATSPQEHQFNMPYQMAHPDNLPETDTAADAQIYQITVRPGDVIILATDGLYDNMWDEQLVSLVAAATASIASDTTVAANPQSAVQQLATSLTTTAFRQSQDPAFRSPWAVEIANQPSASWLARLFPRGGRLDDITVVVALVVPWRDEGTDGGGGESRQPSG